MAKEQKQNKKNKKMEAASEICCGKGENKKEGNNCCE